MNEWQENFNVAIRQRDALQDRINRAASYVDNYCESYTRGPLLAILNGTERGGDDV